MSDWPELKVDDWSDTRDSLHMWTQVIGKVRMELAQPVNHWWHVPLYVSVRGLTTGLVPYGNRNFEIELDVVDQVLRVETDDPALRTFPLGPMPVASFYQQLMGTLEDLGLVVEILARPVEVVEAIPFAEDTTHTAYDPAAAEAFWRQLTNAERVFTAFRGEFLGKVSPVHMFWGALDLAVSRFSGRTAPTHPGGAPNCADWVMEKAYSHEVSSAGFFAGGAAEGAFYSYAYPAPPGYADYPVEPAGAHYDPALDEFILPYTKVRTASDPDETLLRFLRSTYAAAADLGGWDRHALELPA